MKLSTLPTRKWGTNKISLPTILLWLNLILSSTGLFSQTTNRTYSGTEITEAWNARLMVDGMNANSRNPHALQLDNIKYNGNIYVMYKDYLSEDLVEYFKREFHRPWDYIFMWFTKNKNRTWKWESKVSVFTSKFRDENLSNTLQTQLTTWLKGLKTNNQLNQEQVLLLIEWILSEHYGTLWQTSETSQDNSPVTISWEHSNESWEYKNKSNNGYWLYITIWLCIIWICIAYKMKPQWFISNNDTDKKEWKWNEISAIENQLQEEISKLDELCKQYEFFIYSKNKYQYILPDNFEEIIKEAGERVTIFQNAKKTGTFDDNKGLLWTNLGKTGKINEDITLTQNALEGLKKLWLCYSIISTIDQIQSLSNTAETQSEYKQSDLESSKTTYNNLQSSNTSWINSQLWISSFSELESKKEILIAKLQNALQELAWIIQSPTTWSWNQYVALLETATSTESSERKTRNRADQLHDEEYLITTSDYCSKLIAKIKEEIDNISGTLYKINSLPTTIAQYEQEYSEKIRKIESLNSSIEQRKELYPQLVGVDSSITTLEKDSDLLLSQASKLYWEPKKDWPVINSKINTSLHDIEKVDSIYKNFHNTKEDYFATKVNIGSIRTEIIVYTENSDYDNLPEYVSQWNIALKIAQLPHSDSKKENWFDLHKNALALYRTLDNLKTRFKEYKTAKENYESNLQIINALNIRLVSLASDAWRTYQQVLISPKQWNWFTLEEETDRTIKQMRARESDFEQDIRNNSSTTVVVIWWNSGWWWNNWWSVNTWNDNWWRSSSPDPTPDFAAEDNSWPGDTI